MAPRLLVGVVQLHLDVTAFVSLLSASRLSLGADLVRIARSVVAVKDNEGTPLSMVPIAAFDFLVHMAGSDVLGLVPLAA